MLYEVALYGMPEMNISLLPWAEDTAAIRERLAVAPVSQKKVTYSLFRSI